MPDSSLHTLQLVSVRWWNASAYYGISLADALRQSGVEATAGGRRDSPPIRKAPEFNVPCFDAINLETFNPLQVLNNVHRINRFVEARNISLINAHRPEDGFFAAISRKAARRPYAVIRTVSDVRSPKNHRLNRWLHERGMDFIIFSCRANYDRYQAVWPIFAERSAVIYSAIDTARFKPGRGYPSLRSQLGFSDREVVVGIVARLSPVKDHHTFLRAAARVAAASEHARFLVSGEEAQLSHDQLRQTARELGIADRVVFMHRDFNISADEIIRCLDIGVVASRGSEVICRVAVEFMALGRPQVVTDINVLPEIVDDGKNGFVVPSGDHEAMADRLIRLVEEKELYSRMSVTARHYAEERFSYEVFARRTLDVYRAALERLS